MSGDDRLDLSAIDRGAGTRQPQPLTKDRLVELVDAASDEAERSRWQSKLDAIEAKEERAARANAMTAREVVDSIPRGGFQ